MDRIAYSYGCVMALLPGSVANKIREFGASIPAEDLYDDGSGEHGRESEIHVTVKYGLHDPNPENVREGLEWQDMAYATLGKVDAFHNDDYVVLKINVSSAGMADGHDE